MNRHLMALPTITYDPTIPRNIAPTRGEQSVVASFELDELIRLGGTAMKAELTDWLIDHHPALAQVGIRELMDHIGGGVA